MWNVRPARQADATDLGRAHSEAWRVGYAGLFDADFLARAVEDRRSRWDAELSGPPLESTLLVAETDGAVVGFVHVGVVDASGRGEINGFYVHPDHWGTGVAQTLFDEGVSLLVAQQADLGALWTLSGAGRARRFYERNGWTLTGHTKTYDYGDGRPSDLVEYALVLDPR